MISLTQISLTQISLTQIRLFQTALTETGLALIRLTQWVISNVRRGYALPFPFSFGHA